MSQASSSMRLHCCKPEANILTNLPNKKTNGSAHRHAVQYKSKKTADMQMSQQKMKFSHEEMARRTSAPLNINSRKHARASGPTMDI